MRLSAAIFGFLFLAIHGLANACTPLPNHISQVDNYQRYKKTDWDFDIWDENSFVTLIKTKKKKIRKEESPTKAYYWWGEPEELKIKNPVNRVYEFELVVVENLKGEFNPSKNFDAPKMTKEKKMLEAEYLAKPKTFDFWDGLDLTSPTSSWHGISACGGPASETLLKDHYYLVFGKDSEARYFEPLSSLDDPLLTKFRKVFSQTTEHALLRTPKNFFSHMTGFKTVKARTCPFGEGSEDDHYIWRPSNATKETFENSIETLDSYNSQHPITIQNFMSNVKCYPGDKYLVLERLFEPSRPTIGFVIVEPKHRFVKIEDGEIDTRTIPSRITIKEPYILPVEQVKTWIREGREAASVIED